MNFACFIEAMPTIIRSAEGIYAAYSDKHDVMLAARQRGTARFEYARSGHDMILGYPLEDLVIGGVRRGRLLKSKNPKYNVDFTYCFLKRMN